MVDLKYNCISFYRFFEEKLRRLEDTEYLRDEEINQRFDGKDLFVRLYNKT